MLALLGGLVGEMAGELSCSIDLDVTRFSRGGRVLRCEGGQQN